MKIWELGPFTRPVKKPVIKPSSEPVFSCPVRQQPVRWAENHAFNPAAIVCRDKIHILFRAEDGHGDDIGMYCSRIGHAESSDGITMHLANAPVLYPAKDKWEAEEWPGGCEDPRIIEGADASFVLYYTMYNRKAPAKIGAATSPDLQTWTKHGPVFDASCGNLGWHKAAGVVQSIQNGRLVAVRIHGLYWMYWGEDSIHLATSSDLVKWTPVRDKNNNILSLISPRRGCFDSALTEVGPPPILTDYGIVLIYNGKNNFTQGDSDIDPGAYSAGQVLFDRNDPARVLDRLDKPFLKPELSFERSGQYKNGTVFAQGLVFFRNKWLLYYGAADTCVGVATSEYKEVHK